MKHFSRIFDIIMLLEATPEQGKQGMYSYVFLFFLDGL